VLENGRVRLSGTGTEVLEHPEIGALYLGGAVTSGAVTNLEDAPPASPPSSTGTRTPGS
jgi:hypothetical protein